jgi:hypothetical protein
LIISHPEEYKLRMFDDRVLRRYLDWREVVTRGWKNCIIKIFIICIISLLG